MNHNQVIINLATNMFVFVLNIIINLFMTPFYIKYVGIEGLGIIRITLLLPIYISLITLIISGTVSRFLTIDLQRENKNNANKTFNSSFFGIIFILCIILPIILLFSFNVNYFLNISDIYKDETLFLFLGILLSSQLSIFATLFLIPSYAKNRLDIQNYVKISSLVIQNLFIIIIFIFIASKIAYVGYAYLLASIISVIISFYMWKYFSPNLVINFKYFRVKKIIEMSKMGIWLIINQLGSILFLSIDLIIINHYFGAVSAGIYSVLLQWSILIRSLGTMLSSIIGPLIIRNYADNNYKNIIKYSKFAVKYVGIGISIPVGIIIGFSNPLLTLWVGEKFIEYIPIMNILLIHLTINLAVLPLFYINTAFNKVKVPALVTLIFGFINIILAIALSVNYNLELYGIALASAIILTIKNTVFLPIYAAYIQDLHLFTYLRDILVSIMTMFITIFVAMSLEYYVNIDNWFMLLGLMIITSIPILIIIYIFILSKEEKDILKNILNKKDKNEKTNKKHY